MEIPRPSTFDRPPTGGRGNPPGGRLNLLLSAAGHVAWRDDSWADALPRLLEPMGVQSWRVRSGREAAAVMKGTSVHIAVVDLALPLEPARAGLEQISATEEGGSRLLELLGRLPTPPPTVVIKRERTQREHARALSSALEAGAFAVLERPVHIETALEVLRRILSKFYHGRWPGCC